MSLGLVAVSRKGAKGLNIGVVSILDRMFGGPTVQAGVIAAMIVEWGAILLERLGVTLLKVGGEMRYVSPP